MIRKIAGKEYRYPEVDQLVADCLHVENEGRVILVVGQPGSGKSVLVSQLYDELDEKVQYLTAIRAEFLEESATPKDVYNMFKRVGEEKKPKVLVLDSLDTLAYSRRTELLDWLWCVGRVCRIRGMTVICTSREFEAEHLYPMNQQDWSQKMRLAPLSDEFVDKVLEKVGYDYRSISPDFRSFLRIPLHLRIAAEIIRDKGDPGNIHVLHSLYEKLFELLEVSRTDMDFLAKLASMMIDNRTTYLDFTHIRTELLNYNTRMGGRGTTAGLQIDDAHCRVTFSHQTLIDYLIAWQMIESRKTIVDFVLDRDQSLFIRPTIRHILGLLRAQSSHRLFAELTELFFGRRRLFVGFGRVMPDIRVHVKTAVIANMASWDAPTPQETRFLLRLFREPKNANILLVQFFDSLPNPDWFDALKDIYILRIIRAKDHTDFEYRNVLSFLTLLLPKIPDKILEIALVLLATSPNYSTQVFFHKLSDELGQLTDHNSDLAKRYASILGQAVEKGFLTWYYELLLSCQRIGRHLPDRALELYFKFLLGDLKAEAPSGTRADTNLVESYHEFLPAIYGRIPHSVLLACTGFFEKILSSTARCEGELLDSPQSLLYAKHTERFGVRAFYEWYRKGVLEFCRRLTDEAKELMGKLEQSQWSSQKQLAMLAKLENTSHFKAEILEYTKRVIGRIPADPEVGKEFDMFVRAIEGLNSVGTDEQRSAIVQSILELPLTTRSEVQLWIWGPLHHIPETLLDKAAKSKLREIKEKYGFGEYIYAPPIRSTGMRAVQVPIPASKLREMAPEKLYAYLMRNRDLRERWDSDTDVFFGGVEHLAREVSKVLVENLEKYRNLVDKLAKDLASSGYIFWTLAEIAQRGAPDKEIDWLVHLISRVYRTEKLQLQIARVLVKIADRLSDDQFARLEHVLLELAQAKDPEKDRFFEYRKSGYANDALTEGINSTRGELAGLVVLLLSRFIAGYLVEILEALSKDKTVSVRAALVMNLPAAIGTLGWDKCFQLFSKAFQKSPEEYHKVIIRFLKHVPADKFGSLDTVLEKIWEDPASVLGGAYSTLMTIYYLRGIVTCDKLLGILTYPQLSTEAKRESFSLVANQLRFERSVARSLELMLRLLDEETDMAGRVSIAFMRARVEDLDRFVPLIEVVLSRPSLRHESLYHVLEYLEKCLLIDPKTVFRLLERALGRADSEIHNIRDFQAAARSKAPLNIVNTMLECYPDYEKRAMKVLDRLIELRWGGISDYLRACDRL